MYIDKSYQFQTLSASVDICVCLCACICACGCVWSQAWRLLALSCVNLSLWSFCLQHNVTTGQEPKPSTDQHHLAGDANWSIQYVLQLRQRESKAGGIGRGSWLGYCCKVFSCNWKSESDQVAPFLPNKQNSMNKCSRYFQFWRWVSGEVHHFIYWCLINIWWREQPICPI